MIRKKLHKEDQPCRKKKNSTAILWSASASERMSCTPEKLLYTQQEAARIMGCHRNTIGRHGLKTDITCERLARAFA